VAVILLWGFSAEPGGVDGTTSFCKKGGDPMKNNKKYCCSHRIELEKLKQKTWRLFVLARFLVFLAILASYCLRRT
jgi:hypothetical protein